MKLRFSGLKPLWILAVRTLNEKGSPGEGIVLVGDMVELRSFNQAGAHASCCKPLLGKHMRIGVALCNPLPPAHARNGAQGAVEQKHGQKKEGAPARPLAPACVDKGTTSRYGAASHSAVTTCLDTTLCLPFSSQVPWVRHRVGHPGGGDHPGRRGGHGGPYGRVRRQKSLVALRRVRRKRF